MLVTQTALECYFMPDDAAQCHEVMVGMIDSAKATIRVICYGFTDPDLIDALIRAHARGVDLRLILDLTQSRGTAEVPQLHRLMMAIGADKVRIGTSTQHAIIHDKCCVIDGLATVPDEQFATVGEARAAGYPVTMEGSLNWSPSALKQSNTVMLLPSKVYAAALHTFFDASWKFLTEKEPQYQITSVA